MKNILISYGNNLYKKSIDLLEKTYKEIGKDDEFFRSLFDDKELVRLSKALFGHIPGTERLYGK